MTIKVIQWTSGRVARQCMKAILSHPDLELVGMYAHSKSKAGKDAGELAGLPPLGIKATHDINALIALKPDCVSYSPLYPNVDDLVSLLEAGINVVTTSNFMTGWGINARENRYGPNSRKRIEAAARKGNASIFGTGINPGHINCMAGVISAYCQRIRHIKITESVDVINFAGDPNSDNIGYGLPRNSPGHEEMIRLETGVFGDALEVMAQMMGVTLDEIRCTVTFAYATEDISLPGRFIAKDTVAGVRICWEGIVDGRPLLENLQIWTVGEKIDPPWKVEHGYLIDIQGDPNIHNRMLPLPEGDLASMTLEDLNALGMRITALPSINAIPAVCEAEAGIRTYNDLPLITGRGRLAHYE